MTAAEYKSKRSFLLSVLQDAKERGDYFLEFDTIELLEQLDTIELKEKS